MRPVGKPGEIMFDNQSAAFLFLPGLVAAFAALLVNARINREVPGVGWWPVGIGLQALGTLIRASQTPWFGQFSYVLVNLLLIGGQFVMLLGLCRFAGRPMFTRSAIATLVALALGIGYASLVIDNVATRTTCFALGLSIPLLLQFSILPRIARREGVAAVVVMAGAYGLVMIFSYVRAGIMITVGSQALRPLHLGENLSLTGRQAIVSLTTTLLATAFSYGYILLVVGRNHWQVQQLAIADSLTGVANRRAFDAEIRQAASRARRSGARLGLALMDLDHFKRVNDTHGHAAGDALLCHFVRVVGEVLRETDFFARIGGEEFGLLLPDASGESVIHAAERIRMALEIDPLVREGKTIRATVSIGAVVSGPGGADPERLYAAADQALYRAKAGGRNRVEGEASPVETPLPFPAIEAVK